MDLDWFEAVVRAIRARHAAEEVSIDPGPLPLVPRAVTLASLLAGRRRSTLLLDAGWANARLRSLAGWPGEHDTLQTCLSEAFFRGCEAIRLRFRIGLPGETLQDVQGILDVVLDGQQTGQRALGERPRIRVIVEPLALMPHSGLERQGTAAFLDLETKLALLRRGFRKASVYAMLPDPKTAAIRDAILRGGRETGKATRLAWELGCLSGQPLEELTAGWEQAFQDDGLDVYAQSATGYAPGAPLPWAHLDFQTSPPAHSPTWGPLGEG